MGQRAGRRFATSLKALDLTPPRFGVLNQLASQDGQTQQDLADVLSVHRNVMVGLIDELERHGFVERHRHPSDRRAYEVRMTDKGQRVLPEAQRMADENDEFFLGGLTEKERVAFMRMLKSRSAIEHDQMGSW